MIKFGSASDQIILQYVCHIYTKVYSTAMQSQKAVTAYFSSKQLLRFGFLRQA